MLAFPLLMGQKTLGGQLFTLIKLFVGDFLHYQNRAYHLSQTVLWIIGYCRSTVPMDVK